MPIEERVIEEAVLALRTLAVSHNDRLDSYFLALEKSREEFEFKINALVDSQIRTEAEIDKLHKITESHSIRIANIENKLEN